MRVRARPRCLLCQKRTSLTGYRIISRDGEGKVVCLSCGTRIIPYLTSPDWELIVVKKELVPITDFIRPGWGAGPDPVWDLGEYLVTKFCCQDPEVKEAYRLVDLLGKAILYFPLDPDRVRPSSEELNERIRKWVIENWDSPIGRSFCFELARRLSAGFLEYTMGHPRDYDGDKWVVDLRDMWALAEMRRNPEELADLFSKTWEGLWV